MKLDFDCIRDFLFKAEEMIDITDNYLTSAVKLSEIISDLPQYSPQDIYYTAIKLEEAKFITIYRESGLRRAPNDFAITDITYEGHRYINAVRDNSIWKKVKSAAKSLTLTVAQQAAERLLLQEIGI